jgi:hypothetical protein
VEVLDHDDERAPGSRRQQDVGHRLEQLDPLGLRDPAVAAEHGHEGTERVMSRSGPGAHGGRAVTHDE